MASDPENNPVPPKKRGPAKGTKRTKVEEPAAMNQPAAVEQPAAAIEQPEVVNPPADKLPEGDEPKQDTKKANEVGPALENQPAVEQPAAVEQPVEAEEQVVEVVPAPEKPAVVNPQAASEKPVVVAQKETKPAVETKKPDVKKPETKKVETRAPASTLKAPVEKKAAKPTFSAVLRSIFLLVLETLLPVILAAVVVWYGFGYFNFWANNRTAMLMLFAVTLVAISLMLSIIFDTLSAPLRKSSRKKGLRFYSDPRTRVVKIALGGLLLPLAAFAAANLVTLPARGQVMNLIISSSAPVVKLTPSDEVGLLALQSENPATKQLSIQVLQGQRSPEGLSQLMRLVNEDPAALQDAGVADTLAKAIASYGLQAKGPLVVAFQSVDPAALSGGGAPAGDLYERYFSRSFESMQAEVSASTADTALREARLTQLQAAEAQLKTTLGEVAAPDETDGLAAGDPRPDFVLRTFLAMDLQQDPDLLALARNTAADKRYSSAVRGDALLLVAKLGDKDSLNVLFPYLKETDELIQARTLQAIAALQDKLSNVPITNP